MADQIVILGHIARVHAGKLPAWTLRLRGARGDLIRAVRSRSRRETIRALEDVWFWVGRLTGEALAAVSDPRHGAVAKVAFDEIVKAQRDVFAARRLLGG